MQMFWPVKRSMTVSAPNYAASRRLFTSSSIEETAELPIFARLVQLANEEGHVITSLESIVLAVAKLRG
jgi:hypothetical protein